MEESKPLCWEVLTGTSWSRRDQPREPIESRKVFDAMATGYNIGDSGSGMDKSFEEMQMLRNGVVVEVDLMFESSLRRESSSAQLFHCLVTDKRGRQSAK